MSDLDWSLVAKIFADAVELDVESRSAFVSARCAEQPALKAAVERLLEANSLAEPGFLRGLDADSVAAMARVVVEPPEAVGVYRLGPMIARGGMGEVFLADRADGQFEQRVAVKLLKRGMDSDAILARFLRERQILAGLSHPNIARLLDGGVAIDGRPYFVMEYVDGLPITRYCDEHRLSVSERLDLFCIVCRAVEYAHRNLILHRDLKPSNILVTADGQPKLLDFGIARMLAATDAGAEPTLTQSGALMLTPEYAAPEQFRGEAVTTTTDVYSLGAVLYELLVGRRPFPARSLRTAHSERTWEGAAPPLSKAVTLSRDDAQAGERPLEARAEDRSTDAARLRKQVAGDLETIAATALQSAVDRRYASVEALRQDITRHQQQLPVLARPDTVSYRVSRFVRRHRASVIAGSALILLVLAFAAAALVQTSRIRKQALDLKVERDRARSEAAAAERVSDFLVSVFEVSDPMARGGGDSIPARNLLDRGAERAETELASQPEQLARMLSVMARAYYNLSRSDRAEPLLERAVELQRAATGDTSQGVIATMQQLADVQQRRGNQAAAQITLREALARQARINPRSPVMSSLLVDLATVIHTRGDNQLVAATAADALQRMDSIPQDQRLSSRIALSKLASLLGYTHDWDRLDDVHRRLVEIERSTSGPRSEAVAVAYTSWAESKQRAGRIPAADTLQTLALAIFREINTRSVATADAMIKLGAVARAAGNPDRADSLFRAAIEVYRERLGEDHRSVATARSILASALVRRGKPLEAIPLFERALASYRQESDSAVILLVTKYQLAVALRDARRLSEAERLFRDALSDFTVRYPPDYLITANLRRDFAGALIDLNRPAEAETLLRQAIPVLARRWGENDVRVDMVRIDLGRALTALARYAEADEVFSGALRRLEQGRDSENSITQRARDAYAALQKARSGGRLR